MNDGRPEYIGWVWRSLRFIVVAELVEFIKEFGLLTWSFDGAKVCFDFLLFLKGCDVHSGRNL